MIASIDFFFHLFYHPWGSFFFSFSFNLFQRIKVHSGYQWLNTLRFFFAFNWRSEVISVQQMNFVDWANPMDCRVGLWSRLEWERHSFLDHRSDDHRSVDEHWKNSFISFLLNDQLTRCSSNWLNSIVSCSSEWTILSTLVLSVPNWIPSHWYRSVVQPWRENRIRSTTIRSFGVSFFLPSLIRIEFFQNTWTG